MKFILVFSTVLITLASSLLLDYSAELTNPSTLVLLLIIGFVLFINFLKFGLWGWIHKNFDISKTYPITAVYFPMILAAAYWQGEAALTAPKVIGVLFIIAGIILHGGNKKATKLETNA